MIPLVKDNQDAIIALCKQYGVRKLSLFGSAATGNFDPATSDLDFLIDFSDYGAGVGRRFMTFAIALEDLLGRSVDLVFESVIKDRDFLQEVRDTQETLYDAGEGTEAVA